MKPCPKCGSTELELPIAGSIGVRFAYVRCRKCGHVGPIVKGKERDEIKASKLWEDAG